MKSYINLNYSSIFLTSSLLILGYDGFNILGWIQENDFISLGLLLINPAPIVGDKSAIFKSGLSVSLIILAFFKRRKSRIEEVLFYNFYLGLFCYSS